MLSWCKQPQAVLARRQGAQHHLQVQGEAARSLEAALPSS